MLLLVSRAVNTCTWVKTLAVIPSSRDHLGNPVQHVLHQTIIVWKPSACATSNNNCFFFLHISISSDLPMITMGVSFSSWRHLKLITTTIADVSTAAHHHSTRRAQFTSNTQKRQAIVKHSINTIHFPPTKHTPLTPPHKHAIGKEGAWAGRWGSLTKKETNALI